MAKHVFEREAIPTKYLEEVDKSKYQLSQEELEEFDQKVREWVAMPDGQDKEILGQALKKVATRVRPPKRDTGLFDAVTRAVSYIPDVAWTAAREVVAAPISVAQGRQVGMPPKALLDALVLKRDFPPTSAYLERAGVSPEHALPVGLALDVGPAAANAVTGGVRSGAKLLKRIPGVARAAKAPNILEAIASLGDSASKAITKFDPYTSAVQGISRMWFGQTPALAEADRLARINRAAVKPSDIAWEKRVSGWSPGDLAEDLNRVIGDLSDSRSAAVTQATAAGPRLGTRNTTLGELTQEVQDIASGVATRPGQKKIAPQVRKQLMSYLRETPAGDISPERLHEISQAYGKAARSMGAYEKSLDLTRTASSAAASDLLEESLKESFRRMGRFSNEKLAQSVSNAAPSVMDGAKRAEKFSTEGSQMRGLIDAQLIASEQAKQSVWARALNNPVKNASAIAPGIAFGVAAQDPSVGILTALAGLAASSTPATTKATRAVWEATPIVSGVSRANTRYRVGAPTEWDLIQWELKKQENKEGK